MEPSEDLLAAAETETGLSDFGDDSFREGLERLVASLRKEAALNAVGRKGVRRLLVGLLAQRLQVEDWYRRHPEIDDERIDAPLFGVGLPRTGSTALAFLLAEDPTVRYLRRWEAPEPCPPPSTVVGPDPRIARAEAQTALQARVTPRLAALVPFSATGPYECQDLMGLDFRSTYFQAYAHVPSYASWLLRETDLGSTYRYVRRVLKLLQWGAPTRPWRLKNPSHLLFLPALDAAFPDARFVMTHRDPADVLLSVADTYAEVAGMFSDDVDRRYLGALNVEHWSVGMERALAFRDAGNDPRFYDMHFAAVQRDPIGEVRGLYAWLGEPVSEAFEAGMRRWWREHAESRAPNVHPDPADFGLDLAEIRPLFAAYVERMARWTAR